MRTSFELALSFTLPEETGGDPEGGLHTDPHDPGGTTRWGIAQRYHPEVDVANLTRDGATALYYVKYWLAGRCDALPPPVAVAHFDACVLPGPGRAARFLQAAVGAEIDGHIGQDTLDAVASYGGGRGWEVAARDVVIARWRWFANASDDPEKEDERRRLRFVEGWGVRLLRLVAYTQHLEDQ